MQTTTAMADRVRAQEEIFLQQLEAKRPRDGEARRARGALRTETGIDDDAALDALIAIGLDRGMLPAVEAIPLVLVAWADGDVAASERDAILRAVEAHGVTERHPAHALVRSWLERRTPGQVKLLRAWRAYVAALASREDQEARTERAERLQHEVREVAQADGGWLGFGRVSRNEGALIAEIERSLHAHVWS